MAKRKQGPSAGAGGGERSEPEPGPADGRGTGSTPPGGRLGRGEGTSRTYTPEERRWALEAWEKSGLGLEVFARQWGISGPTLREWKKAYDRAGPKGLEHPTATGRTRGAKPLAAPVAAEIVETKRSFPDFGLRKIRDYLARFAGLRVSAGGVRAVLAREGVPRTEPPKRRGRGRPAVRRFERAAPGELWQSDITSFRLARESRPVYLIVFLDDHSRYVAAWGLHLRQTSAIAMETLLDGVQRYGKPREVLTDQGRQYFAWRGKTAFQKLLDREGIRHVVSRAHHPETLGKCERLWETVGRELWDRAHPQDLAEARERLGHYFHHYNFFRPHQGLGGMVPADRFFGAESEVRRAIEKTISKNALRLALGERPRKPVYLVGQVDGEVVSLHGERGRLVVATKEGSKQVDLAELGIRKERADGDDASNGGKVGEDRGRDGERAGGGDAGAGDVGCNDGHGVTDGAVADAAPAAAACGDLEVGAAGLSDQGDLGRGDGRGAGPGAGARDGTPRPVARAADEGGPREEAPGPADPGLADEPAGGGRDGGGDAAAAGGPGGADAAARPGGAGAACAGGGPGEGARGLEEPGHAPAVDAGERAPGTPQGGERCSAPPSPSSASGEARSLPSSGNGSCCSSCGRMIPSPSPKLPGSPA
jgi:transposase InsO family protein